MTKSELIDLVAQRTGRPKAVAEDVVNSVIEEVSAALARGEKVALQGFGSFEAKERAGRKGTHPITGKPMVIEPKMVARFKPSGVLTDRLN